MSDAKSYELSTIRDIYEKVPPEKVEECMAELAELIVSAQGIDRVLRSAASIQGVEMEKHAWPDSVEWLDDGKGSIEVNVSHDEKTVLSLRSEKHA